MRSQEEMLAIILKKAKQEEHIRAALLQGSRVSKEAKPDCFQDYDVVFLGYPIWWDLCPRPVNTFLEKYDFAGKTVIPFATSGGSSITGSVKQLKRLYPKIEWEEGRLCNRSTKQVGDWVKQAIE